MDLISALCLFLGLAEIVSRPPVYEIEHFYTYNADHKQVGLPLTGKILVPNACGLQEFINEGGQGDADVEKVTTSQFEGVVFICKDKRKALELLKTLTAKNLKAFPVVKWQGMDVVPSEFILVKTKPHVTEATLKERINKSGQIVVKEITKIGDYTYQIEVAKLALPPNIIVAANMMAEDTAWFQSARVMFRPIHSHIEARTFIEQPAATTLAEERVLKTVITVRKPSIKVLKDTIPVLGQNKWIPAPQTLDVWYDFGKPVHKMEVIEDGYIITITQPFRFCAIVPVIIPSSAFIYEDMGEKFTCMVNGCTYVNSSLIAGTRIEDIQPLPDIRPLPELERVGQPQAQSSWNGYSTYTLFGLGMVGVSLTVIVLLVLVKLNNVRVSTFLRWGAKKERARLWDELEASIFHLTASDGWRESYEGVTTALSKVLAEFYNVKRPITASECEDSKVRIVLAELEMMYRPDYEPDSATLSELADNLKILVGERTKFNV